MYNVFFLDPNPLSINVLPNANQQENGFRQGQIIVTYNRSSFTPTYLDVPSAVISKSSSKCIFMQTFSCSTRFA